MTTISTPSDRYPRVLVSMVVSGTLSSWTLRYNELVRFVHISRLHAVYPYRGYFLTLRCLVSIHSHFSFRATSLPVGHLMLLSRFSSS
jgi:hypothetical protein